MENDARNRTNAKDSEADQSQYRYSQLNADEQKEHVKQGNTVHISKADTNTVAILHGTWFGDKFQKRTPEKAPIMTVTMSVTQSAHLSFGKRWLKAEQAKPIEFDCVADTGAQIVTAGMEILTTLKVPESYLLKTKHRITGISSTSLDVKGALVVLIQVEGRRTQQIVYVCKNVKGIYLSHSALKDLGAIPEDFPIADSFPMTTKVNVCREMENRRAKCGCPVRAATPELPDEMPYPSTSENQEKLEVCIKEFFAQVHSMNVHTNLYRVWPVHQWG